ncbi:MAG: MMPL family transporter [Actinobacteria bacterium]|nr:MMPL family transporter [Actinomycetota bacterium]
MKLSPEAIARASSRHPWRTIVAWLVAIVTMGAVSTALLAGVLTQDVSFTNRPESVRAQDLIDAKFGGSQADDTEFLILSSGAAVASDAEYQQRMQELKAEATKLGKGVVAGPIFSYVDAQAQARALLTPDEHGALLPLRLGDGDASSVFASIQRAATSAAPAGFEVAVLTPEQVARSQGGGTPQGPAPADAPAGYALVTSSATSTSAPSFASAVKAVQDAIVKSAGSSLVQPPVSGFDLEHEAARLISADGHTALLPVPIAASGDGIVKDLRAVAARMSGGGFTVQVVGNATLQADFTKIAEEDLRQGESIGIAIALTVLVVVFAAVVAAFVPVIMGIFAIAVALGLVSLIGQLVEFNLFVENMVSMIGLAVGIDYSLFIVSRYREERKKGFDKMEAIGAAGATANRAVFFSGMTVVLALLGMFIIPTTIFRSLATGAILVTLASIGASMTLLPAILSLLGDRVNWPRLSKRARVDSDHDPKGGFWDRVTRGVMARPVVFLLVSVAALGGLGSFYFQLHRGTSTNVTQLPDGFESKAAFLTLQREFNAGGATDPVRIVVTGGVESSQVQGAIAKLQSEIAQTPAFSKQTTVTSAVDGSATMVEAYFRGDPSSDPAFAAIGDLRDRLVPQAFEDVNGVTALVGGNTAFFTDFLHVTDRYQWIVLAFVLGLSFVLLTVVFRSIVVPAKAITMNLLSVGAAYGAITLVFQKGVGIGFFNSIGFKFQQTPSIEAWLPLFLFSILFGLSMDYHVFLLTRIREEYDKTGDNAEAVAYGLRTTAGLITGAALIMVAVFTGFAAGRLGPLQQMGFGLAVAVFMDATVVRSLLVPASMRLLGDVNWYLPKWLEWLPKIDVEGHEPELAVMDVPETQAELVGEAAE